MSADEIPLRDGTPEGDSALAAEFVIRLLPAAEEAAVAARVARDPAFATLVDGWRADLSALDGGFAETAPRPRVKASVEKRLFGRRRSGLGRVWGSVALWRGLALAAGAVALWLAVAAPRPEVSGQPGARLISAIQPLEGELSVLALIEPQAAVLSLNRVTGDPAPGRVQELWLIEPDAAPVSLGVLPEADRIRLPLSRELAERIVAGATLAISDEPEGGSPTGQPTGTVLAAGPVTEL